LLQSLTANAGAQLLLQSLATQAGLATQANQPRIYPGIAAAAHNQLSQLLGATASPPRQGVVLQQFLQNSLSATSTTTNLTKLATTANAADNTVTLPQALQQALPQGLPQAMSPPSQPVFQPVAKTQVQLPAPQAGAAQPQPTAARVAQMGAPPVQNAAPKPQTASGIPPLMEAAFLQYLQVSGRISLPPHAFILFRVKAGENILTLVGSSLYQSYATESVSVPLQVSLTAMRKYKCAICLR